MKIVFVVALGCNLSAHANSNGSDSVKSPLVYDLQLLPKANVGIWPLKG